MTALPNPTVPLFEWNGEAASPLRDLLSGKGVLPRGALVDFEGRATPSFRNYLSDKVVAPLPHASAAFADNLGRPTRVFTMLLAGLR